MKKLLKKITVAALSLSLLFNNLSFGSLIDLLRNLGGVSVCSGDSSGGDLNPLPYDDLQDCKN